MSFGNKIFKVFDTVDKALGEIHPSLNPQHTNWDAQQQQLQKSINAGGMPFVYTPYDQKDVVPQGTQSITQLDNGNYVKGDPKVTVTPSATTAPPPDRVVVIGSPPPADIPAEPAPEPAPEPVVTKKNDPVDTVTAAADTKKQKKSIKVDSSDEARSKRIAALVSGDTGLEIDPLGRKGKARSSRVSMLGR